MTSRSREEGQVTVFTLLCMTCLLGFIAFATDVGMLLRARRVVQAAADAAAIAGAAEINYAGFDGSSVVAAARSAAAANGMVDGSNGVTVTVNQGPSAGDPYAGNTSYVEVNIRQSEPAFFISVFNRTLAVSSRAVAGLIGKNRNCIFVLNGSGAGAMQLANSTISAFNCGVAINSNDANALQFSGGAPALSASSVSIVGGDGGQDGDSTPTPVTGAAPVSDPLAFITPPDPSTLSCTTTATLTGTVSPSSPGGAACYSGDVSISNATFNPGTYVFTGIVSFSGNVSTTASGATFDINTRYIVVNSGTNFNLTAPSSGAFRGIVLLQPSANNSAILLQNGNAQGSITGIIYAPSGSFALTNNPSGLTFVTDLVVGSVVLSNSSLTLQDYSSAYPSNSPLLVPVLVE